MKTWAFLTYAIGGTLAILFGTLGAGHFRPEVRVGRRRPRCWAGDQRRRLRLVQLHRTTRRGI